MLWLEQYANWVNGREQIDYTECVVDKHSEVNDILKKCKFPKKLLGFLFFSKEKAFQRLNTFYLPQNGEYTKETYMENEALINKYIFVCTANGNAICINDETGAIEEINSTDFEVVFVNNSFEEFMEFLLYYAELLMTVEDIKRNVTRVNLLKKEDVESFARKISDVAGENWDKYVFWRNKIDFLFFYTGLKDS